MDDARVPESIRIYARMGVVEYTQWVDKIMSVRHVDAARTVSLPVMGLIVLWSYLTV